jgi:HlyD family secretion protein
MPNYTPDNHTTLTNSHDWSYATKELLDTLPQAWTRGLLYFIGAFIAIALPWSFLTKIDETGTARGRIEPREETVKLDAPVTGTVANIRVKEGDLVKQGEVLLTLDSDLVKSELKQSQDKLEGLLNRLNQFNLLKSQLVLAISTQKQQNQAGKMEKQTQIAQAEETLKGLENTYNLLQAEKLSQVNQVKAELKNREIADKLAAIRWHNAQREVKRYHDAWKEGIAAEIQIAEREDIAQERQRIYEQSKSDIEQSKLHLDEQKSIYEKSLKQANNDIEQAKLRLKEQKVSLQALIHSHQLETLRIEEQIKNVNTDIASLKAEILQTHSQIDSLKFQLTQRTLKASVSGMVFHLPIQKEGAVVQPGTRIAEIAAQNSPLILRANMPTTESGSLQKGLKAKLKLDAYPFQDYGIIEGELIKISPTTSLLETSEGKVEVYKLEINLDKTCMPTANRCIPLRPGDTATAEVIVRQRRIIDFILDPFKKLQNGGFKL